MFAHKFPVEAVEIDLRVQDGCLEQEQSVEPRFDGLLLYALDVVIASLTLLFLLPLMGLIALAIYLTNGGPVIFAHKRIGLHAQEFPCLKFRTMSHNANARLAHLLATNPEARAEWERDHKLRRDPRITRLGAFLRKTSLDELPQLFNVLRGDMSLVGPRPIVVGEVPRYGRYFSEYCSVKPGITGLWQVSGRNDVSYRRRVAMDVMYTRHRSAATNLWILLVTLPSVLASRGSY